MSAVRLGAGDKGDITRRLLDSADQVAQQRAGRVEVGQDV